VSRLEELAAIMSRHLRQWVLGNRFPMCRKP
jgi:hypothetical protein